MSSSSPNSASGLKGVVERFYQDTKLLLLRSYRRSLMTRDLLYVILTMVENLFYAVKGRAVV